MGGGPRVVLGPAFRPTLGVAVARLLGGEVIRLSARSSLYLDGDISLEGPLELDGALSVRAVGAGVRVVIRRLRVHNEGHTFRELSAAELQSADVPEVARLRGYELVAGAVEELVFDKPGEWVVER